jgi:hypothetical protein
MPLIEDSRASVYDTKMEIGWILFNISDGSQEGLEMWLDFLQRDPEKYNEAKAVFRWSKMSKKGMTLGSLKFIARKDSPEKYGSIYKFLTTELPDINLIYNPPKLSSKIFDRNGTLLYKFYEETKSL